MFSTLVQLPPTSFRKYVKKALDQLLHVDKLSGSKFIMSRLFPSRRDINNLETLHVSVGGMGTWGENYSTLCTLTRFIGGHQLEGWGACELSHHNMSQQSVLRASKANPRPGIVCWTMRNPSGNWWSRSSKVMGAWLLLFYFNQCVATVTDSLHPRCFLSLSRSLLIESPFRNNSISFIHVIQRTPMDSYGL